MTRPSENEETNLWDDGEFVLLRTGSGLLTVPAQTQPAPKSIAQLRHALAFRDDVDLEWAARPIELTQRRGQPALLMEDPGGEPLARLIGDPWDVESFLRIAISIAVSLTRLHKQGLIHRDIKPTNILVDNEKGAAWLTGFGITLRQGTTLPSLTPPEMIAGTLAYMAPEQTGRMNRSVDSRSDLYSCGMTFYEMLTGVLPFKAADTMEWIHCQVAWQPEPLKERVQGIPVIISDIISKLIAKNAEDRYQTAAGLAADFRRCLAGWQSLSRIDPFPLGAQDVPEILRIPEKLYGREREIETLRAAYYRVAASGKNEMVLVSGYSGVGKSSVVTDLKKTVVSSQGFFAEGKFDQYQRDIPYSTLAQALRSLIVRILAQSEAEVLRWRDAFQSALGINGQLIVNLVPSVEGVIGRQVPLPDITPQEQGKRFHSVLGRFLSVFAQAGHPLVLFFDDLQWLDAATLDVIEHLAIDPEGRNVLLIGAYRENEVTVQHPLARRLETIREAGATVGDLHLAPLQQEDLGQLICDTFDCEPSRAGPLVQLVQERTAGNPFFAIQFLMARAAEHLISLDADASWTWDLAGIGHKGYTDNVGDLIAERVGRLPTKAQEALRLLSCVGTRGDLSTLALVSQTSEEETSSILVEVVRAGLVARENGAYAFVHDRVQEAAYALIPEADRPRAHLQIGQALARNVPAGKREDTIFEIVGHLNQGAGLLDAREDREFAAELNLMAGKRARTGTAYRAGLTYFAAGEDLLEPDCWERQYGLTFALSLNRAECEFLAGDVTAAEERLAKLVHRAVNITDLAAATCLRVVIYTTLDRIDRAIEVGLEYLTRCGIVWTADPPADVARDEYDLLLQRLAGRSILSLADLPPLEDPEWRATVDVLVAMLPAAIFSGKHLNALAHLRIANISMERGNCSASCLAYSQLSQILGPHFGNYDAGYRFGELGMELAERPEYWSVRDRVHLVFAYHVNPWTRPLRDSRKLLESAFDASIASGDLLFAAFATTHLVSIALATGDPLDEVLVQAEKGLEFDLNSRYGLVADCVNGQVGLIRSLRGLPPRFLSLSGDVHEERQFEEHLEGDSALALAASWHWLHKLQSRFFLGDYSSAMKAAVRAEEVVRISPTFFERAEYHFYAALGRAARSATSWGENDMRALQTDYKQLLAWAQNAPFNFADRVALVEAEIARIEGRPLDAMRLYERSIKLARGQGFIQNEALGNELAGRFYLAHGIEASANAYLRDARSCYLRWGADGKVRQIDRLHPELNQERLPVPSSTSITTSVDQLDLATVLKISSAVSSEMLLEKLIDKLLRTAIEHAGAERGLLILPKNGELEIHAEANTDGSLLTVGLRERPISSDDLSESVVQFAARAQESVILDDASAWGPFSNDEYIHRKRARSILCIPLVKQGRLVAVLYLENNLAAGVFAPARTVAASQVFTPSRIAVLKLLASQAAIALENARLYGDLREAQDYLAEAQRLSATGSFGWKPLSGEIVWSEETYRIFALDQTTKPTIEFALSRVHTEDRHHVRQLIDRATAQAKDWDLEHRIVMPDGVVKHLHVVGHPVHDEFTGGIEYVGAVMDVTERKRAQEDVQRVVDFVPQVIVVQGPGDNWTHANRVAREYTGLTLDEFRSQDVIGRVIHREDIERMRLACQHGLAGSEPFELDARLLGKDGIYRWFLFRYNPLVEAGQATRWYASATEIESRKREEDRVRQENIRLEERTRIARELHDTLLQTVQSSSLLLGAALYEVASDSSVKPRLERILELMEHGAEEGRKAIQGLRSSDSRTSDLVLALSRIQEELKVQPNIDFHVTVRGQPRQLPSQIQNEIYRIGREALLNAFYHSGAKRVQLELEYSDSELRMQVRDNGCGLDPQVLHKGLEGHWGLAGMRERATTIGGQLEISSSAKTGTEIQLSIPGRLAFQLSSADQSSSDAGTSLGTKDTA